MANDDRLSESYKQKFKQQEAKLNSYNRELERMRQELFVAENRAAKAESSLKNAQKATATAVTPPPPVQQNMTALQARVTELEQQLRRNTETTDVVNASMESMINACREMREENDKLLESNAQLREEADESKKQLSEARAEIEKWKVEVRRLEQLMEYKEERILGFTAKQKEAMWALSQEREEGSILRQKEQPSDSTSAFQAPPAPLESLRTELTTLQAQYDALVVTHKKAAAKYEEHYQKWHNFKRWLLGEEKKAHAERKTLPPGERKAYELQRIETKRRRFQQMAGSSPAVKSTPNDNLSAIPSSSAPIELTSAATPAPPSSSPDSSQPTPATLPRMASPNAADARVQVRSSPIAPSSETLRRKRSLESTMPAVTTPSAKRRRSSSDSSSDTEDETQAPGPSSPFLRRLLDVSPERPANTSASSSRPLSPRGHPQPEFDALFTMTPSRKRLDKVPRPVFEPPAKPFSPVQPISHPKVVVKQEPLASPPVSPSNEHPPIVKEEDQSQTTFVEGSSKASPPKTRVEAVKATPRRAARKSGDYSAFKGRGRYATSNSDKDKNTTINAQFRVNTEHNAGRDFQYDEVVRNRHDRRQLTGADCECCRDYYEAVGVIPPQLQRPAWRSPTTSPVVGNRINRTCLHERESLNDVDFSQDSSAPGVDDDMSNLQRQKAIQNHRNEISRHRAQWERPPTPPRYWDVGFPSTQEVAQINDQAKAIQMQKLEAARKEAESGNGKYVRR